MLKLTELFTNIKMSIYDSLDMNFPQKNPLSLLNFTSNSEEI